MYIDGSKELLEGCTNCNGKFFFYIRKSKLEEQKKVISEVMETASTVRKIAKQAVSLAQQAMADQDYEQARIYLEYVLHLGQLISQDFEAMTIARLLGIAVQQLTLNELIKLHEATGSDKELQKATLLLKTAKEQAAQIKKLATGG